VSDCRRDRLTAAALGLVSVLWLLAVEGKQGIGRDEAQYFRAGERYWGWFESGWQNLRDGHFGRTFSRAGIDAFWASPAGEVPRVRVTEIAPIMLLLALCLALTVQAGPALRYMEATAQSLHVPRDYVRNALSAPRATEQVERGGP